MLISSTIVGIINAEIQQLLGDVLDEDDTLGGTETFQQIGLNSLMLARLVIALEDELGVDPFSSGASIVDMHTLNDLWAAYEGAVGQESVVQL